MTIRVVEIIRLKSADGRTRLDSGWSGCEIENLSRADRVKQGDRSSDRGDFYRNLRLL